MINKSCLLQGKYVVLFFYPLDFTFVCPTEITAFSDRHGEFEKLNAEVSVALVISDEIQCVRHPAVRPQRFVPCF